MVEFHVDLIFTIGYFYSTKMNLKQNRVQLFSEVYIFSCILYCPLFSLITGKNLVFQS